MNKFKNILILVGYDIAKFYPCFLLIYIGIYVMSLFFPLWQIFWKQPELHIATLLFGIIFLFERERTLRLVHIFSEKGLVYLIKFLVLHIVDFGTVKLRFLGKKIKTGYFIRWFAGVAIFFLVLCPILLLVKKDLWADQLAIYAYYFLAISVILGIVEYFFNKNKSEKAHL